MGKNLKPRGRQLPFGVACGTLSIISYFSRRHLPRSLHSLCRFPRLPRRCRCRYPRPVPGSTHTNHTLHLATLPHSSSAVTINAAVSPKNLTGFDGSGSLSLSLLLSLSLCAIAVAPAVAVVVIPGRLWNDHLALLLAAPDVDHLTVGDRHGLAEYARSVAPDQEQKRLAEIVSTFSNTHHSSTDPVTEQRPLVGCRPAGRDLTADEDAPQSRALVPCVSHATYARQPHEEAAYSDQPHNVNTAQVKLARLIQTRSVSLTPSTPLRGTLVRLCAKSRGARPRNNKISGRPRSRQLQFGVSEIDYAHSQTTHGLPIQHVTGTRDAE